LGATINLSFLHEARKTPVAGIRWIMDPSNVNKTIINNTVRVEHRTTVDVLSVAYHKQTSVNRIRAIFAADLELVNFDIVVVCFETTSYALIKRYQGIRA